MPQAYARTSINQNPYGGDRYPFKVDEYASEFVLDFYLSYADDTCSYVLPLQLSEILISDGIPVSPANLPTNTRDVVITDGDGNTVMDTRTATYQEIAWGTRIVCEWHLDENVCRIVFDGTVEAAFPQYYEPVNPELDARTYHRLGRRVKAILLESDTFTGNIRLESGFNVTTTIATVTEQDGGQRSTSVLLQADPGSGLGRAPGCEETVPVLRTINGQSADESGNFFVEYDPCIRRKLGFSVESDEAYFPEDEDKSTIRLDSDCQPCCPCSFFVRTYKGLTRMYSRWLTIANNAEVARDLYHQNRQRWIDQKDCRTSNPIKLSAVTEPACTMSFGVSYCNTSKACITPVEIRVTIETYDGGVLVEDAEAVACSQVYVNGSHTKIGEEPYALQGEYPTFYAVLPYLNPQQQGTLRFRLLSRDCTTERSLRVIASIHAPDPAPAYPDFTVVLPDLGDGFDSAYPIRALTEAYRPLNDARLTYGCVISNDNTGGGGGGDSDNGDGGDGVRLEFNDVPAGSVNGVNAVFTLNHEPDPSSDILLFVNGLLQRQGASFDYTLVGDTITFNAGAVPTTGDTLLASYRY